MEQKTTKNYTVEDVIPAKVIAEILGTSENHVNKVRRGKRGGRSILCDKIKRCDKFIADKIVIEKALYENKVNETLLQARDRFSHQ